MRFRFLAEVAGFLVLVAVFLAAGAVSHLLQQLRRLR